MNLPSKKCPGRCGFTAAFYQRINDRLMPMLPTLFRKQKGTGHHQTHSVTPVQYYLDTSLVCYPLQRSTLISAYSLQSIMHGSQGRSSRQAGTEAETAKKHCLLADLPWLIRFAFLYHRDYLLRRMGKTLKLVWKHTGLQKGIVILRTKAILKILKCLILNCSK